MRQRLARNSLGFLIDRPAPAKTPGPDSPRAERPRFARAMAMCVLVSLIACGDETPADVAGEYSLTVVNGANGCELQPWGDAPATDVKATITQQGNDGTQAQLQVNGLVATILLTSQLGGTEFAGTVDGNELALDREGTAEKERGACRYTIRATIDATLDGDTLSGRIRYRALTNQSADCGPLVACASDQTFNGTRPPRQ